MNPATLVTLIGRCAVLSGYAAFVDFYPNGALHFRRGNHGGQPLHLCGSYQFNQTQLQRPKLCLTGVCEPPPFPLNQPTSTQYQFTNPNKLLLSNGDHYVRQPGNPFPLPPSGCN